MRLLKSNAAFGISQGKKKAELGVWTRGTRPLVKLQIRYVGPWSGDQEPTATYVFLPLPKKDFWQSLEIPLPLVELLVGSHRATSGKLTFEFLFSDNGKRQLTADIKDILTLYRGMGRKGPSSVSRLPSTRRPAPKEQHSWDAAAILKEDEEIKLRAQKEKEERERLAEEKRRAEAEARKKAAAPAPKAGAPASASAAPAAFDAGGAKIGLFYGSTTGNTAGVSEALRACFPEGLVKTVNVTEVGPEALKAFDYLILGVPTWHIGEMQEDWTVLLPKLPGMDLKGKKLAIFGLGDMVGYPDTYVDAMEELWRSFKPLGTELVGLWPTDGYKFNKSKAIIDGKFMGMVIDIENQNNLTDERVKKWAGQLKAEFGV